MKDDYEKEICPQCESPDLKPTVDGNGKVWTQCQFKDCLYFWEPVV